MDNSLKKFRKVKQVLQPIVRTWCSLISIIPVYIEVLSQILLKRKYVFLVQPGRILNTIWTLSPPTILHFLHSN